VGGVTATLSTWGAVSRTVDLDGPMHYADFGGPPGAPPIVCVHGLGGSHLNWAPIGSLLAEQARVFAPDLAGFGLTEPLGRRTGVPDNAALLHRFLVEVVGEPALLVGNSMGGMICTIVGAARPNAVRGLVLVDPALPQPRGMPFDRAVFGTFLRYAVPGIGERFMARRRSTLSPEETVQGVLDVCCVEPSRVPAELVEASAELVRTRTEMPGLDRAFLAAARSLLRINARKRRYRAVMRAVRAPVLIIHGEFDRLIPAAAARQAAAHNPSWRLEVLPDVGHVPQIEAPHAVSRLILEWLAATR
jgi:pimeloyl-ACP methyl ester carboxylesterase